MILDDSPSNGTGEPPVKEIIDLVDKPHSSRCLNSACNGTSTDFFRAPDFCLSYYRVKRSKNHREEICEDCYSKSVQDFDKLSTTLKEGELILSVDYPIINETLQIEDSDEEEDTGDDLTDYISKENYDFICQNIDDVLQETMEQLKVESHFEKEAEYLKKECSKVEGLYVSFYQLDGYYLFFPEDYTDLTKKVKDIRQVLDGIQLNLYNQFRPDFRSLKGLSITDDHTQSPNTIIKVGKDKKQLPEVKNSFTKHVSFRCNTGKSKKECPHPQTRVLR